MRKSSVLFQYGVVVVVLLLIVIANFISFFMYQTNEQLLRKLEKERYEHSLLAHELQLISDELTRLARSYVVIGDSRYVNQYWEINAIRSGIKPGVQQHHIESPEHLVTSTQYPRTNVEKRALLASMYQGGITNSELARLQEAEESSIALMKLETAAMDLVKHDGLAGARMSYSDNRMKAIDMLYSEEYKQRKVAIRRSIEDFYVMVDTHTHGQIGAIEQHVSFYRALTILFQWLLFLIAAGIGWRLLRNIYWNEKKWTKPLMDTGLGGLPGVIVEKQVALGLDAIDMNIILYLAYSWKQTHLLPSPTVEDIAKNIGLGTRTVQKHVSTLHTAGLLTRIQRSDSQRGNYANLYSLQGLIEAALPYVQPKPNLEEIVGIRQDNCSWLLSLRRHLGKWVGRNKHTEQ